MRLDRLLSQSSLVSYSPPAADILDRLGRGRAAKVFYGETFDPHGPPIDSLKYYFFVADLADALRSEGVEAAPQILIADTAACRNVGTEHRRAYMTLGRERAAFVERVNDIYGTGLTVRLMSDFIDSPQFQSVVSRVRSTCENDPALLAMVERSVPESKLEEERKKGFMYSFDEIATILDLDVKAGPPREDLYDGIAREIAAREGTPPLLSVFLTPTFPLGMNWAYFFANEGIEDHGITAYKAGSKRLQSKRIIIGKSRIDYVDALIQQSFLPSDPGLPNPVLDVGMIAEAARRRLEGDDGSPSLAQRFRSGALSPAELRRQVTDDVHEYVLARFEG